MRKILIHSIVFSPDGVSTAYLYNDIAIKFRESGYKVIVLTTTPHYNVISEEVHKQHLRPRFLGLYYESDYFGIKVLHVPQRKFKSTFFRIAGFLYWHVITFFLGLSERNISVILSPSPPLTIGLVNILLGSIKRAKVIYNVQEIYPDLLIKAGSLNSRLLIYVLRKIEALVYNYSDMVIAIDQVFYDTIIDRFKDPKKLIIIPNFVDIELFSSVNNHSGKLDPDFFSSTESLKVIYAGNIGIAQDWELLIRLAVTLKRENINFYIIGEGVFKDYLVKEVNLNSLEKVHILPYQNRKNMPLINAFADLHFIFMRKSMDDLGFPSKVYTILASAKPLLVCSSEYSPIVKFLRNLNCSYIIDNNDIEEAVKTAAELLRNMNREQLKHYGKVGQNEIILNYSKEVILNRYINTVNSLFE